MTWDEMYDMSLRSLVNKIEGFSAESNFQYQNGWQQTRWFATVVIAQINKKVRKPSDLIRFPWENSGTDNPGPLTKEERERRFGKMDELARKRFEQSNQKRQ